MNECLKLITERRSITFFDPSKEVALGLVKEILETSAVAPSGYNLQPWQVVVVLDKDKKRLLRDICYGQKKVEDASANIVIIANTRAGFENADRALNSWVELGYIQPSTKESLKKSIEAGWMDLQRARKKAIRDSALFAMNLMITARAYGLETHPMEGYDEARLREFLDLKEYQEPVMIIAMGHKDQGQNLLPRAYRFKFDEFAKII